ncbi:hypothetical protein TrVE_jg5975 [Triparma verrucosa]|uniref:CNNM transmembrane domain-containing protein n=1 Tax=Triparma verrucosa TaxID=1606542 RepID=A0A9W7BLH0_9STRA|nr:hypothetical protein TrVE_jg5975 [Triparma verrucosa]
MNELLQWLLIVVLIMLSGLFSGLTLGLLGLDKTGLEIVMGGTDEVAKANAKRIAPVRANGNQLLCTLLLGNVAVNAMLSILTADIFGGTSGFLISTAVIVVFGEIIPQASCSRYALQIGSASIPVVKFLMFCLAPLAYPMAWCLDRALGEEMGTIHSKSEMKKLLEIHVQRGGFDAEAGKAMAGALQYQDMQVHEVMTPLDDVFMISIDDKLTFELIAEVFKSGFSRIPVYEIDEDNIVGLLLVKDLIFVDPEDETPVKSFIQIFGRGLHVVWPDQSLGDCLRTFKQGRGHMALVRDVSYDDEHPERDPTYVVKGIITLEDIIEEILGAEIVDETDVFVDVDNHIKVDRRTFDWSRLRMLDARAVDKTLSADEVKAASAHLLTNHSDVFSKLSESQLHTLVASTPVVELDVDEMKKEYEGTMQKVDSWEVVPDAVLYERGKKSSYSTLILSGKVIILAGKDKFRADAGAWKVLGADALMSDIYEPDFTAFASPEKKTDGNTNKVRCLKIDRRQFTVAMAASSIEFAANGRKDGGGQAGKRLSGGDSQDEDGKPTSKGMPEKGRSWRNQRKRSGREKMLMTGNAISTTRNIASSGDEGASESDGFIKARVRKPARVPFNVSQGSDDDGIGERDSEELGDSDIESQKKVRRESRAKKYSKVQERLAKGADSNPPPDILTSSTSTEPAASKRMSLLQSGKSVSFIESGRNATKYLKELKDDESGDEAGGGGEP